MQNANPGAYKGKNPSQFSFYRSKTETEQYTHLKESIYFNTSLTCDAPECRRRLLYKLTQHVKKRNRGNRQTVQGDKLQMAKNFTQDL